MSTFVGSGFALESITHNAPATIRVKFTQDPKAVDEGASDDALNPSLYSLSGPGANLVDNVGSVHGDPQSVDLFLQGVLTPGTWTLTVAGTLVAYDLTTPIEAPLSIALTVENVLRQSPINPGATNDPAENVLRKFLNPFLKGDNWDAMISAIATGEQANWDNAKLAFDQLFVSSASGMYLDRLGADNGITKPINVGMSDELFREYIIRLTNNKLTQQSLLELMEIFYGQDAVRAYSLCDIAEPYEMEDEDDLTILFDEQVEVHVVFTDDDFAITGQATAIEIATAITNACRISDTDAFAIPYIDPTSGSTYVKIYSGSLGLASSVRITGGKAQNALKFSEELGIYDGLSLPTWTVTVNTATGRTRFATDSANINLGLLVEGDYVNIYGSEFDEDNRGSFPVVEVHYAYSGMTLDQWFEVDNADGFAQNTPQLGADSILYFRPQRATIHSTAEREVIVAQPIGTRVDIVLPATSQAVHRTNANAAYAQLNDALTVSSLQRIAGVVTVETTAAHGLSVGDQVQVDGVYGTFGTPPIIAAPDASHTSSSIGSTWSELPGALYDGRLHGISCLLGNGNVWVAGGDTGPNSYVFSVLGMPSILFEDKYESTDTGGYSWGFGIDQFIPGLTTWNETLSSGDYVLIHSYSGLYGNTASTVKVGLYSSSGITFGGDFGYTHPRDAYQHAPYFKSINVPYTGAHDIRSIWNATPGTAYIDHFYDGTHGFGSRNYYVLQAEMLSTDGTTTSGVGTATYNSGSWTDVTEYASWATFVPAGPQMLTVRMSGMRSGGSFGQFRITMDGVALDQEDGWVVLDNFYGGCPTLLVPVFGDDDVHTFQIQYKAITGSLTLALSSAGYRHFTLINCDLDFNSQLSPTSGITSYFDPNWTTITDYPSWTTSVSEAGDYTLCLKLTGIGSSTGYSELRVLMDGSPVGTPMHFSSNGGQQAMPHIFVPVSFEDTDPHTFQVQIKVYDGTFHVIGLYSGMQYGSRTYYLLKPSGATQRQAQFEIEAGNYQFKVDSLTDTDGRKVAEYEYIIGLASPNKGFLCGTTGNLGSYDLFGSVLVTGGSFDGTAATNEVEVYHADHHVDEASFLNEARMGHTQVTLDDGRFMVMGGTTAAAGASPLDSCEIYDRATDTWTTVSPMNEARAGHKAVVLSDGRVLVVSGQSLEDGDLLWETEANIGRLLSTCEIYDPDTDTWTNTGTMSIGRVQHELVLLPDGRVLCVGGVGVNPTQSGDEAEALLDAEVWDPQTNLWIPAGRTAYRRDTPVVGLLSSKDQVIVAGGSYSNTTEIFDLNTFKWRIGNAVLPTSRYGSLGVLMADDLLFLSGGVDATTFARDDIDMLYLPNEDTFLTGGLNGQFRVTSVPSSTSFTYETPSVPSYTVGNVSNASVTPISSAESSLRGPYLFSPASGVAITGTSTEISQDLAKGHRYNVVDVADASDFPDEEGWLVFDFGYENQVGPVRYFGRISDTALSLDYNFRFPSNVDSGAKVHLLYQKGPYDPGGHVEGAFYLTDSPAGRIAAEAAIDAATAAGVDVNKEIVYPGDRGLGGEGYPAKGNYKVSDKVGVWGGNEPDTDMQNAREDDE